jgi:Ca2+-binding EF-hand superfamily protein
MDLDGGGSLDAKELRAALTDVGLNTPAAAPKIAQVEASGVGLDIKAFKALVKELKAAPALLARAQTMGTGETVGAVFRRMDVDGGGTLDAKELRAALTDIGLPLNTPAAVQALERAEAAGGGLDVKAFKAIVKALKAAPSATAIVDQGYEAEAGES